MVGIFSQEGSCAKQRFRERLKWIRDAELRTRYLIVIHLLEGQTVTWISRTLKISRNTVYRTKQRYETEGESGLFDQEENQGTPTFSKILTCDLLYPLIQFDSYYFLPHRIGGDRGQACPNGSVCSG